MVPRDGHSRGGAARGRWAVAARLLALVLALFLVAPVSGYAIDLAYHECHRHGAELTMADAAPDADAADPGIASHLHCGCHQLAPLTSSPDEPLVEVARPAYARLSETVSSIAPDRLPEPPRA